MLNPTATLSLPIQWTIATRLPRHGWLLPEGALAWPMTGQRIVAFERRPFEDDDALTEPRPDVVIAEVADLPALRRLLAVVFAERLAGIALVEGPVPPAVQAEVLGLTRDFVVIEAPGPRQAFDPDASRALAEIVRRRVYRTLIAHWRGAYARHVAALVALGDGIPVPVLDLARPVMAPLSTIERVHIDGVLGLWLPAGAKPAGRLGVSHGRLRRAVSELPPALAEATAAKGPATLRAMVLEDDPGLGAFVKRLVERHAARSGRHVEVEVLARADDARRRIEHAGAPELLCVDVGLEDPAAGVAFLEWLRRGGAGSVVLGKSGSADPAAVRALWRLGAYGVWTGEGPGALEREVASLFDAVGETAAIQAAAAQSTVLAASLETQVQRGLLAAALVQEARSARTIVHGLEADLAELPGEPLRAEARLDAVRIEAARRAIEIAAGNRSAAARLLGIDVGTLARLVR